jgi:hypothetical protein
MKRTAHLMVALLTAGVLSLSSCMTTTSYMITNNPLGTKKSDTKTKMLKLNQDVSLATTAKKGNISKIGLVQMKVRGVQMHTIIMGE